MRVRVADRGVVLRMAAKATSRAEGRPRPAGSRGKTGQDGAQYPAILPGRLAWVKEMGEGPSPVSPEEPDAGKPHVRICEGGGR